jgi:hypothetical protein
VSVTNTERRRVPPVMAVSTSTGPRPANLAQLRAIAEEVGAITGTLARRQRESDDRTAAAIDAVTELLLDLERRIAAIEQERSARTGPRRVLDAAD